MTFCQPAVCFNTQAPPIFFMVCMLLMGITGIVIKTVYTLIRSKRCTKQITAVCSHLDTKYKNRAVVYCPTYTFHYEGKKYSVCDNSYSNVGVPALGTTVTLYIDPENPNIFYYRSAIQDGFIYCICGFLILIPIGFFFSR